MIIIYIRNQREQLAKSIVKSYETRAVIIIVLL